MMRLVLTIAAVALLCSVTLVSVQAAPIIYTITTTATGTLGASPFTNAAVTLTLAGDTSAVTSGPSPSLNNFLISPGAATVKIAGLGTATLTGSIEILSTFNTPLNGSLGVVIGQLDNPAGTSVTGILGTSSPTFSGYNLQTALGPVSGTGSVANKGQADEFFPTTAGNLQFAPGQGGGAGTSTFTATTGSPVTYIYTGKPFTVCTYGICPANYTSDYLTASITFSAPLAPGLPLTNLTSSLTAWTIGDALGNFSFSSTGPTSSYLTGYPSLGIPPLSVSTNSSGGIVDYGMSAFPAEVLGLKGTSEGLVINPTQSASCQSGRTCTFADAVEINWGLATEWDAISSIPGQWTTTAAATCSSLAVAPNEFTFAQGGGNGTVNFNASPCGWSITGNPSWITLPASSGTVPSFSFTVAPNPGATRQATFSINGGALTVAITQTGLVCTYAITDSTAGFGASRSFTSGGGSGGINVVAPPGCPWTATSNQSSIAISGNASGNGNGSVNYTVVANSSSNPQAGTIAIAGLAYIVNEQPANALPNVCSISSGVPSPIRPEGFAEKVADVVFTCQGQAPSGGLIGDVLITFNTGITNVLLKTGQTDALLLEDEPAAANLALGTNAFRGLLSSVNGTEAILFPGVQLASVNGGTFQHTWRITNARVNAQALAPGTSVQATVSITATAPFTVNSQPTVAFISSPSTFSAGGSSGAKTSQGVAFNEGFATAFQPRLAANQDPSQVGTVYNSESGYVNSKVLGNQTGFATSGTRLILVLGNVPAGVSVIAPVASASGPSAVLVSADSTGAGGFPVSGTSQLICPIAPAVNCPSSVTVTWEVTASNPNSIETVLFNLGFTNPNNVSLSGVTYAGAIAPVSSGAAPQLPSTNLPAPRFASSTVKVTPPATVSLSVAPQGGTSQGSALTPALRSEATPSSSVVGGTVSWTQVQANTNPASAVNAPNVAVIGTLPPTWVIASCTPVDSGGVCPGIDPNNPTNSYTAAYPSLSPGQTGTIMLTAQSTGQTSGAVEYTSSIDSDLANSDFAAGSFTTNFPVSEIGLNINLTHASNFSQGQTGAQYNVTVANGGSLPTNLPVTVTETLPPSLTLVSMSGAGWTCTVSSSSCTRSDALAGNSSYPSIAVTVNVASNAPSSVTNQAVVLTGVLEATASDPTNIAAGSVPAFFNGQVSLGSGVDYLQFPNGNLFGYYNSASFPILYHYDLGFEAFVDGGNGGAYMYDFASGHWFYTSISLFPYLYDFTLNNWLYYFPDAKTAGHYTSNPRYFSNLGTGKILTM